MTLAWALVLLAGALAAGFAWLWQRRARESARLGDLLDQASLDLQRLQTTFARFAPETVVDHIASGEIPETGERKEVTVLFADLVDFTPLSEQVEPPVLVRILNGYFERTSRAITEHRGYVSTFIGDGVLALFGAFEPNPWQSDDAVRAALAMRHELAAYNEELHAEGLPALGIGIGLHRGTGVAGLVGSRDLIQYAFVGGTINVAARVQSHTRDHNTDILLTEAVRKELDPRFPLRPLPPAQLKGIAKPVATWAVEDGAPGA